MANQEITARLKLQSEGLTEAADEASRTHKELVGAAKAAEALSRAQADAARKATLKTTKENVEYGQMRGTAGVTGAASRDFAEQSRGLGGLVRLYATVAANVFALTAAFNALSRAMDTTNMIAGLDALGASSGRALGTLSKQLAQVSDGAISLREAMSATAMSSSAGMTNQQILRMGEVAKNASLALGISMPDAINRLSRGITKLEPELLDELGIFTKIEPAVQSYALQLGKSVSGLTDFERRQAFANAVLKEGEDKFSAIGDQIAANPYDKLSASLRNVAQDGLELLNKVLGPIAEILSKSPSALTGGLLLLIATLTKRALPALGEFRQSLEAERQKAESLVKQKKADTLAAGQALGDLASKKVLQQMEANAESELRIFERKEATLNQLKSRGANYSKQLNDLLKKDIHDISQQEIDEVKKSARARLDAARTAYTEMQKLEKKGVYTERPEKQRIKEEAKTAGVEMATVTALEKTTKAETAYTKARLDGIAAETKRLEQTARYQRLLAAEESLTVQARRSQIIANMAYNTSILGIGDAFRLMQDEASKAGNVGNKFTLGMRALAAGIGTIITSALGAIGAIIQAITLAITAFSALDAVLSGNAKEAQRFNDALDNSNSSVKAVNNTLEEYEKRGSNSIKSTIALATAFGELSDSMEISINRFQKMQDASNGWDKFWDNVKGLFGYGQADKLADTLSKQLYAALDVADKFSKKGELQARLQEYLGVDNLYDEAALKEKIKNLDYLGKQGLSGIAENFKKQFQDVSTVLGNFKDNLDKTYKSFQEFIQGLALTDPFAKFADNYARLAIDMSKVSTMAVGDQLKAIQELLENPEKLVQFDESFIKGLFAISEPFKQAKASLDAYQNQIDVMKRSLTDLNKRIIAEEGRIFKSGAGSQFRARPADEQPFNQKKIDNLKAERDNLEKSIKLSEDYKDNTLKLATVFKDGSQLFATEADKSLQKAAKYTGMAIENSSIRAANTIASAYAGGLSGPQAVAEQTRIAKAEQAIKVREAQIALDMLNSQDTLTSAIQELTAAVSINTEMQKPDTAERAANLERIQRGRDTAMATRMAMQGGTADQIRAAMGSDPRSQGRLSADRQQYVDEIVAAAERGKVARDQRLGMAQAKVGEERAKLTAIDVKGGIEFRAAELAQQKELKDIANSINQAKLSQIDITRQIVGITTLESINEKAKLENISREATQKLEIADIDRRINEAETGYRKAQNAEQRQYYLDQLNFLQGNADLGTEGLKDLIKRRQAEEDIVAAMRKRAEELQVEIETIRKGAELEKSNRDLINAKLEAGLEIRRAQFTSAAELYDLDKQYIVNKTAELDIEKANLDFRKQQGDIQADLANKRLEAEARVAALSQLNDAQKADRVREEFARLEQINKNQLQSLETEKTKRLEILEIQRQQALKQAELAYETDQAARYADALQGAFGNAGKKLGDLATTLIANNQQQLKDQEAIKRAEKASAEAKAESILFQQQMGFESAELSKKAQDATDAETRTKKKARDNELAGNAKSVAMTKAMFKEHTAAYKILATLEKVQHIQRMVNMGIEFATKIGNLGTEVAAKATAEATETGLTLGGFMARAGIYVTEIFSKITSQLGVYGPVVAAGIIAAIGLGAFGRGKGGGGFVPNAEQQQKVQGTAMGYDSSGKQVQVRRGVFGDTEAKSESIAKSLETIKNTSVDGLSYDNKILKALQSIDEGINKTAKSLYSIQGLRTGSMFGTTEGARTSSGFLGISSLFGSSTTTNIQDAGILISGSFADLASATNKGALDFYEVVQRIVKKSGFFGIGGSTKTYIDQNTREVTDEVSQLFSSIFGSAQQTLTELATKTGVMTEKQVTAALSAVQITDVKLSLKGLKGEELAKEVQSVISSILDDAALAVFKSFEQFANFGEGMLETVIRVTDTNEKIAQQVRNLGLAVDLTNLFNVTEALAGATDGLDNFIDKTQFFRENFLTEAERLAPITQSVGKEIARLSKEFPGLGIEAVDTKEEFKRLVQSLDLTTTGGQTLFNALLNIQEGFLQVIDSGEQLTEGQKIVADLQKEIFSLTSGMTALDKSLADIDTKARDYVKELEKTGEATAENILVIGKWVQATRLDLLKNAVVSSFNAVQDALKNQIGTLTTVKQRLVDLKNSLLQGAESVLTPQEKLIAAQTEYNKLLEAAKTGDQAAVDKFSGYAQTLLSATRDVYASGEEYTKVFNQAMSDIDTVTTKVSGDLSTAEKQLQANQDTATGVQSIKDALTFGGKTLAQLQDEFNQSFSNYRTQEAQGAIDAIKESTIKTNVIELYTKLLGRAPEQSGLEFWTKGLMGNLTSLSAVENAIRGSAEGINYADKLKKDQEALTAALKPVVNIQAPAADTTLTTVIKDELVKLNTTIEKQSTKTDDDQREGDSLDVQEQIAAQQLAAQQRATIAKKYSAGLVTRYGTTISYFEE